MNKSRILGLIFVLSITLITSPNIVSASISYGGFVFDDLAFADNVAQLEAGTVQGNISSLLGFSPTTGIFNIGNGSNANLFQLGFTDLLATNGPGADIVLFESYSPDPYEIAVNVVGSGLTSFVLFPQTAMITIVDTAPSSPAYALQIDLDSFGLPGGAIVDAFQFRASTNSNNAIEGDPYMAGVLNAVPIPGAVWLLGSGLIGIVGIRRKFNK